VLEFVILRYQCIDAFKGQPQDYIDKLVKDVRGHLETETGETDKTIEVNEQPQHLKEKIQKPYGMPEDVKAVKSKCKKIYKNEKGFWEADYGDGIIMVYIPPGEFTMGSNDNDNEKPLHTVFLDGYWMGKYEVTFDQYDKYCEEKNKSKPSDQGWGREKRPVINVSWDDASAYCKWMSEKTGLNFKLPTEAQWEKAARGTDSRMYPWGNGEPDETLANFDKNIDKTSPVGSYPNGASPFGLLDTAGNVWEWCNDWYGSDYYKKSPTKNPPGPEIDSKKRVQRSGSWNYDAGYLRCAFRGNGTPSLCFDFVGFRLCQDNK
jgi:formylglycine-generating enzyme required for sulfatase activity